MSKLPTLTPDDPLRAATRVAPAQPAAPPTAAAKEPPAVSYTHLTLPTTPYV